MLNKSKELIVMLIVAMVLVISCGGSSTQSGESAAPEAEAPAEKVAEEKVAPGDVGFDEIPIDETIVGPFSVAAVYFQAVDMLPSGQSPSAAESDLHLEADIALLPEATVKYGFGETEEEGAWPAYLNVEYQIIDKNGKVADEGTFMPMNASDGPHYGTNIKKGVLTVGSYKLKMEITPTNYLLHVDEETGIPGRDDADEYFKTRTVEFDWNYTGEQLQH